MNSKSDPAGITCGDPRKLSVGRTKQCVALRLTFFISSGRPQARRLVRPAEIKNALETKAHSFVLKRDPAGIRTQDPYIKSVLLYQLSYGILIQSRPFACL